MISDSEGKSMYTICIEKYELTGTYVMYFDYKKYGTYHSREEVSVALDALWDRLSYNGRSW